MPKVRVTPIIGLPQFNGWSQVVESPPHSSVKTVLSVAIEGNQAGNVGRDIANYFSSQVVQTLEEFHTLLGEIIDQAVENEVRILCSAGFFSGEECAYAACNGAVLLKREDKIGTVLSSGNQLKLITGRVSLHDVVIFSTLSSAHFFSEIEIKFTQGYDVDTIVTSVVPGLHAEANSSLSSLAFVTFSESAAGLTHLEDEDDTQMPAEAVVDRAQSTTPTGQASYRSQGDREDAAVFEDAPQNDSSPDSDTSDIDTVLPLEEQAVVGTLTASLESPIPLKQTQKKDIGVLVTSGFSKLGALFALFARGLQRLGQIVAPKLKAGFQQSRSAFASLKNREKKESGSGASAQNFALETGRAFRSLLPNKDVYIQTVSSKKMQTIRILVVGASVLLIVGVVFFVVTSKRNSEREAALSLLVPYLERVALSEQMVATDPVSARSEVQAVLREIEDLQAQYDQNSLSYQVISAERENIAQLYTTISGLDELQELPIFYDLRLVSSDFIASKVLMSELVLYFFDIEQKTAISLDSTTKQAAKRDIPVESFFDTALFAADPLILTGSGIGKAVFQEDGLSYDEVIAAGDSNRSATLLGTYTPYLYVVNPEKRNIYRYAQSGGEFSDPIGWVQEIARGLDFSTISSIAIDGDLWLGTKDGSVYKFTRGRAVDFEVRGLQQPFDSTVLVHTSDTLDRLYILEAQNNRVVILQKNGDFIKEISNTSLGSVTDIVVDDAGTSLYAISGSVVFRVEI